MLYHLTASRRVGALNLYVLPENNNHQVSEFFHRENGFENTSIKIRQ
jgi:hypothetical protein